MTAKETAERIAKQVEVLGGRVYYVGGCVRDALMGRESKDTDIEVHGITKEALSGILDGIGHKMEIGVSFGIFGLKGVDLDIAMPRGEKAVGRGHRDFEVTVDPFIGTEKAAVRRDFTVNALLQDVLTGEIIDHFGGQADIENKILRHVSGETFAEDPLRVLRAAQFAARFGFEVAEETVELCSKIDLSHLSKERIEGELKKALLGAEKPSVFFEFLRKTGQLGTWFPELRDLIGVPQNPVYHPEGDVWNHTMLVLDAAAKRRKNAEDPFGLMLAALTHDLGKTVCTQEISGVLHSYNHERIGLPIAEKFLKRITGDKKRIRYVLSLDEYHMKPNTEALGNASEKSTNKMFDSVVDPEALIALALSDRDGQLGKDTEAIEKFLTARLDVYRELMDRPFVGGKELTEAGLVPDSDFSELLTYAHKLRLAGVPQNEALKATLSYAKQIKKQK